MFFLQLRVKGQIRTYVFRPPGLLLTNYFGKMNKCHSRKKKRGGDEYFPKTVLYATRLSKGQRVKLRTLIIVTGKIKPCLADNKGLVMSDSEHRSYALE